VLESAPATQREVSAWVLSNRHVRLILKRVYEAAWLRIVLRDPTRDKVHDAELQAFLRKRVFAFAQSSPVDFDTLYDRVVASIPQHRASPSSKSQP
jgi:hypothetical protein